MPPQRKSKPRSPDHAALAEAVELCIAEDPKMTQETVAFDGDLNPKQISSIVRGQSNPTYTTLIKLADGLHLRLGDLMTRADALRDRRLSR
jgi:transcriptional regulator with XRE-family HTH domain